MATYIIFADASDGYTQSESASYAAARDGTGSLFAFATTTQTNVGQRFFSGTTYIIQQRYMAFDTSALVNPTSATLSLFTMSDNTTTDFTAEARLYDFGATVTTADYVPGGSLGALTLLATFDTSTVSVSTYSDFSEVALVANLNLSGFTSLLICSDRTRLDVTPTGDEFLTWKTAETSGTTEDPKLVIEAATSASSDEILNPAADEATNSWTTDTGGTTDLYAAIDELTASDTDYIQSPAGPTTADYYETALETHADPLSSSGHIVHYRYQKNVAGGNVGLTVELLQGLGLEALTTNQQGLETDSTGWAGQFNCTVARSTSQAHSGAASLQLTAITATDFSAVTPTGTGGIPVVPGTTALASAWVRADATARSCHLRLWWYNSGGTQISNVGATPQTDSTSAWTQLVFSTIVPAAAAFVAVSVYYTLGTVSEVHYVDDISLKLPTAVWSHTNIANSWTQQDQTLTAPQADSITDYSDLRLRFTPDMVTTDQTVPVPTKVADRASANSNSAVTTVDLVLTSLTVGNYLIVRSAADNSGGGGGARSFAVSNLVGTAMGTHTEYQHNQDPGAASAGTTVNLSVIKIGATSGTIRLTYGGSVVQACIAEEWSGIDPTTPVVSAPGTSTGVNNTNLPAPSAIGVLAGNMAYAVHAVEGPATDTYTKTADTTRGTWTALTKVGTSNATADANQTTWAEYKVVTAVGNQMTDADVSVARDSAAMCLELAAAAAPAPTIKAQVSWANLELPAGATAFPHYAGINLGENWPIDGPISAGATDS